MEEDLVEKNLGLIGMAIKQLHLTWETYEQYQEYFDAGLVGLIKGAKKYNYNTGYKISTFLTICIKNEIKHELYLKTMPKRNNSYGKDMSLEYLLLHKDNGFSLIDIIPDPNVNIVEEVIEKDNYEQVLNAIEHLKHEEDKLIIKMYYGLDGYKEMNVEQISKYFKKSKSLIFRNKKRAIKNIRSYLKITNN